MHQGSQNERKKQRGLRLPEVRSDFSHSPSNILGFWADAGLRIGCKSFLLLSCNKWKVWERSLAKVAWFWVAFAFLKIPAPLSVYLFFCRALLISHHLLPGAPGGSDLWTQLQEVFGFFLPLYLLFLNPGIDIYLGKGQRTIFPLLFITRDTNTSPDINIFKVPTEGVGALPTEKASENAQVETKEGTTGPQLSSSHSLEGLHPSLPI